MPQQPMISMGANYTGELTIFLNIVYFRIFEVMLVPFMLGNAQTGALVSEPSTAGAKNIFTV